MAAKRKTDGAKTASSGESFEKALGRLDRIVEDMEGGALSLDEMMTQFEEGQKLVQKCTRTLNDVEKKIFRMTAQDEARHVAYGVMHIKYALVNDPDVAGEIHEILDRGEDMVAGALCQAELLEPLAILMAGGVENIEEGVQGANILWEKIVRDYLHRCDVAGLDRRSRCRLPEESPFV